MYQSSSGVLVMGLKSCLQLLVICLSMDELYILSAAPAKSVVSNSVQPHRQQPIRLLWPWDSPGRNTGVGCHFLLKHMHAKSLQSCPTLCNPMDSSASGSPVHRILQTRILDWVAISFSIYIFSRTQFHHI